MSKQQKREPFECFDCRRTWTSLELFLNWSNYGPSQTLVKWSTLNFSFFERFDYEFFHFERFDCKSTTITESVIFSVPACFPHLFDGKYCKSWLVQFWKKDTCGISTPMETSFRIAKRQKNVNPVFFGIEFILRAISCACVFRRYQTTIFCLLMHPLFGV